MDTVIGYAFGLFFLAISAYFGRRAWLYIGQHRILAAANTTVTSLAPETVSTVSGTVRVDAPAADEHGDAGILAWRIRERRPKGSGRSGGRFSWSTTDGGIDVGALTIDTDAGPVTVDAEAVRGLLAAGVSTPDPWNVPALYLRKPERIERLDEGSELPVAVSTGPVSTENRTQFEATTVEDGDQLLVHGRIIEENDRLVVTRTDDDPFIVSDGPLEQPIADVRIRIATSALFSAVLFAFALAAIGGLFDTVTIG